MSNSHTIQGLANQNGSNIPAAHQPGHRRCPGYFCFINKGGKIHCVDMYWKSSAGGKLFFGKVDFLGMSKGERDKIITE